MRTEGRWNVVLILAGFLVLAFGARAESLGTLVPGAALTDAEINSFYGKGGEGIVFGEFNEIGFTNSGEIVQNNVVCSSPKMSS